MVSASFSLIEAFLSGLFFTALATRSLGRLACDEPLLTYARNKESAALKDRVDRIVKFASSGTANGQSDPFRSLIEVGKRYRDAIHHTTPFERKNLEAGQRLLELYEIKADVGVLCTLLSLESVLTISDWIYGDKDASEITERCKGMRAKIIPYSVEQGLAVVS